MKAVMIILHHTFPLNHCCSIKGTLLPITASVSHKFLLKLLVKPKYYFSTGGNVSITSPLTIVEGNSSSQEFQIVIQLSPSITAVLREVVYTVEVQDGSAAGE